MLARHSLLLALGLALGLGDDVHAQVTSTARTATAWTAMATGATTTTLASGSPLSQVGANDLTAAGTTPGCVPSQPATTTTTGLFAFTATTCRFEADVTAQQPLRCVTPAQSGSFDGGAIWSLSAPTRTAGVLRGTIENPFFRESSGSSSVTVEIIDTKTGIRFAPDPVGPIDRFSQVLRLFPTWSFEWPVVLDSTPREFELRLSVTAGTLSLGNASATGLASIDLAFAPSAPSPVSELGASCGPEFTGYVFERNASNGQTLERGLTLGAGSVPQTTGHFFVFGTTDPNFVLFPTNCTLRTDLAVIIPVLPPTAGTTDLRLDLPLGTPNLQARGQFLAGVFGSGTAQWFTSQGFLLDL